MKALGLILGSAAGYRGMTDLGCSLAVGLVGALVVLVLERLARSALGPRICDSAAMSQ